MLARSYAEESNAPGWFWPSTTRRSRLERQTGWITIWSFKGVYSLPYSLKPLKELNPFESISAQIFPFSIRNDQKVYFKLSDPLRFIGCWYKLSDGIRLQPQIAKKSNTFKGTPIPRCYANGIDVPSDYFCIPSPDLAVSFTQFHVSWIARPSWPRTTVACCL